MQLSIRIDDDCCLVSLDGELDAASSILVDQALDTVRLREQKFVLVNFTLLTYISAAGIGAFIYHIKKMRDCGKFIVFHSMKPSIHHIFVVTGLEELIPIVSCEDEAQLLCRQKACN
jgi:anti-sigma B factor antagonist